MSNRTATRTVTTALAAAALAAGLASCSDSTGRADGPTVAEVQTDAAARQQNQTGPKYPPLPLPAPEERPFSADPEYNGPLPAVDAYALQPGQAPVPAALSRIQEIAANTADMSNRFDEARNYFKQADPFVDVIKGEVDDETWDEITGGIDDMRDALDEAAVTSNHGGDAPKLEAHRAALVRAELASERIALAVVYWLDDNFTR